MKYYSERKTNIIDTACLNNVHLLIAVPMVYMIIAVPMVYMIFMDKM